MLEAVANVLARMPRADGEPEGVAYLSRSRQDDGLGVGVQRGFETCGIAHDRLVEAARGLGCGDHSPRGDDETGDKGAGSDN